MGRNSMDWSQSYSSHWKVYRVNRKTWADAELVDNVDSVKVSRSAGGDLLESGDMEITGDLMPDYYRLVMVVEQGGDVERVDVATLLFTVTGGERNYRATSSEAEGYSVLYPASKTTMLAGEYAPAGVDGADYAGRLLAESINAPVEVEGSFTLNDNVVHEIGSSVLEAVWAVLTAGGFCIQIDGRGVVHIRPKPSEPVLTIDKSNARLLTNGVKFTTDISEVPNRYVVIEGINRTVAVNEDPNSEVSAINRGYFVDMVDESPTPVNGETLGAYANRRLHELSIMNDERTYTREWSPGVNVFDIVRASIDGLTGDLRVIEQAVECEHGIVIEEKANREVSLWQ